jgi:hypothetical protein
VDGVESGTVQALVLVPVHGGVHLAGREGGVASSVYLFFCLVPELGCSHLHLGYPSFPQRAKGPKRLCFFFLAVPFIIFFIFLLAFFTFPTGCYDIVSSFLCTVPCVCGGSRTQALSPSSWSSYPLRVIYIPFGFLRSCISVAASDS